MRSRVCPRSSRSNGPRSSGFSAADIFLKNDASTDTRFTSRRTGRWSRTTSFPKISADPPSGSRRVESRRTSVDFPDPFWPRMATVSPRSIVNVTSSSAIRVFRPKRPFLGSRSLNSLRSSRTSTASCCGR